MTITTSAPGKLLLLGDHAVVYGRPCIVTAVDQRITTEVSMVDEQVLRIMADQVQTDHYVKPLAALGSGEVPKTAAFVEHVVKQFHRRYPLTQGVQVKVSNGFSTKFGFGSSSAVTVAVAKALAQLAQLTLTHHQLFEIAYAAVIDVQGVGSGFDIAAAIWGGTIQYVTPAKVVEPLNLQSLPLVVGYTGIKADTPTIIRQVASLIAKDQVGTDQLFDDSAELVTQAHSAMVSGEWAMVGELMKQNQALLRKLQVSSPELDNLIGAAEQAGAYGAKLSGAGGGDCMIAVTDPQHTTAVAEAITAAGGQVMPVTLQAAGVRVESITN